MVVRPDDGVEYRGLAYDRARLREAVQRARAAVLAAERTRDVILHGRRARVASAPKAR